MATRALILTRPSRASQAQVWPFHLFRRQLAADLQFHFTEHTVSAPAEIDLQRLNEHDVAFVQLKIFRKHPGTLEELLRQLRCKKVLLDDYDSSGNCAFAAAPLVDLYVKKQVLRDVQGYGFVHLNQRPHADYVVDALLGEARQLRPLEIPESFARKLYCGWNIGTARFFHKGPASRQAPADGRRTIDISLRVTAHNGDPLHYYTLHRQNAAAAVAALSAKFAVVNQSRLIQQDEYLAELANSKMCLSPWGYGEVCYRDFEAILAGALLVKPSMDHLKTNPDIYRPWQTFVPVRPDFSDLAQVCRHYLEHEDERRAIAGEAARTFERYFREGRFLVQMHEILKRVFGEAHVPSSPVFTAETTCGGSS